MISTTEHLGTAHHLGLNLVGESTKVLIEIPFPCFSFCYLYPLGIQAISKTQLNLQELKYSCTDLQEATASQKMSCPWTFTSLSWPSVQKRPPYWRVSSWVRDTDGESAHKE